MTDKNIWVIKITSRQLTHIKTNLLAKLNFSITSKTLLSKDIIATTEDGVKDLAKDPATRIKAKTLKQLKALKDSKFIDTSFDTANY